MITPKIKETTILLGAFGFLSKELQETMQNNNITLSTILNTNDWMDLKRVVRLLQRLEVLVGNNLKAEKYLNKCITRVNQKGQYTFINAIVGLTLLGKYKEEWKGKRVGRGIKFDDILNIYDGIERDNQQHLDIIIASQDLSDLLYKEILK